MEDLKELVSAKHSLENFVLSAKYESEKILDKIKQILESKIINEKILLGTHWTIKNDCHLVSTDIHVFKELSGVCVALEIYNNAIYINQDDIEIYANKDSLGELVKSCGLIVDCSLVNEQIKKKEEEIKNYKTFVNDCLEAIKIK